jgi:hypothetical protein
VKPKIGGPTKNANYRASTTHSSRKKDSEIFVRIASRVPVARGASSRRQWPDTQELLFFAVRVVNDLTLLSRSFFSGSLDDTREGLFEPE